MKRHASMNRVYRVIWSRTRGAWMAVGETVRGRGKGSGSRKLLAAALLLSAAGAQAGPTGGQVTGGAGSIAQSGATTTVTQTSQNLSLIWSSFNVGAKEAVNFLQPSISSIAVNRILDVNGSRILGQLNADGQVWLINPNGILFGQGAQVNVGGLVASTLDLNDSTLNGNERRFAGTGKGSVVNRGTINVSEGGYAALLGKKVSNEGTIIARLGTVALGAGSAATLSFSGNSLVKMQVDESLLNTVAQNGGLIRADGGTVLMSAGAKDALLASVVNNTGVIEARTVESREGVIILQGGMRAGTVNVGGRLDASAPNGGDGGFVETSAAHVHVAAGAKVTTKATGGGKTGTWLIDPVDFTIAASGGDITGADLSSNLGSGNVVIESSSGTVGDNGDINVNDAVSWSANKLTLTAARDININAVMTASGASELEMNTAAANGLDAGVPGGTVRVGMNADGSFKGRVDFPGRSGTGFLTINGNGYTVIDGLGFESSTTGNFLQAMNGDLAGYYALGTNIDASPTAVWNVGEGFTPIGDCCSPFTGQFDGLGHTISNLNIRRPGNTPVGLFGAAEAGAEIRNVGLVGVNIKGDNQVGALVGYSYGTVSNSYAIGSVSGNAVLGGLVGINYGTVNNSYAKVSVSGFAATGGLVGVSIGSVGNSYATGHVSSLGPSGGLVGVSYGAISDSYATGSVSGVHNVGGLVGANNGSIDNSYATGSVSGTLYVGGLVGFNFGSVYNSYATGNVSGNSYVGGLAGTSVAPIVNSHATGNVTGSNYVGGLVGMNYGEVTNSFATGGVTGSNYVGGLAGINIGAGINNSYATGNVNGSNYVGGLVGLNAGGIANSYAFGNVSGSDFVGGLVGANYGTINTTYAAGSATATGGPNVGGLVGFNDSFATITGSYWNSDVNSQGVGAGDGSGATGLSREQMRFAENFTSFVFTATPGATDNNWVIVEGNGGLNSNSGGGTAPMLAAEYSTTITNAHQLQLMAMDLSANYKLGRNIDASRTGTGGDVWGSEGFIPVGNASVGAFTGSLNGKGRSIDGLAIYRPLESNVGLFGSTGPAAAISNVGLTGGSVTGGNYSGALVGYNGGSIDNSYATGSVSGGAHSYIGGLVGANYGAISRSYATGEVSGNIDTNGGNIGGLVGWSFGGGSVNNSYATGNVSGGLNVGGLVGLSQGNISNSHATGDVNGFDRVGGLVGYLYGTTPLTIGNSYATGNVTGTYHSDFISNSGIGGLVGSSSYSVIENSYATGSVTGNATYTSFGGLVGYGNQTTVRNSYATGNVSGHVNVGGLVGQLIFGRIENSYAIGHSSGWFGVGGLVGISYSGTISNTYAMGGASGTGHVGGIVGQDAGYVDGTSYYNSDLNATGVGFGSHVATGLSGVRMRQASSFENFAFTTTPGESGNSWVIVNGDRSLNGVGTEGGGTTPMLASEYSTNIHNAHQLQLMAMAPAASYKLARNVDASRTGTGADVWGSEGFVPVGNDGARFTGVFDGQGRTISGLYINRPGDVDVGLFGNTSSASVIRNVGLVGGSVAGLGNVGSLVGANRGAISNSYADVSVGGQDYVGGLVGLSLNGTINSSYATGSVSGNNYVGGLVGYNDSGTVNGSYAAGSVSGNNDVGGLVGRNLLGTIGNSYATGSVDGSLYVGGLVGLAIGGAISNSYATGSVNGGSDVGGLVGQIVLGSIDSSYATGSVIGGAFFGGLVGNNAGGTISNSYWNSDVIGIGVGAGDPTGAIDLTTAGMHSQGSFGAWDFANTWVMYEGYTNPLLRSFMTPLTVMANSGSRTYNRQVYDGSLGASYSGTPDMGNVLGTLSYDSGSAIDVGGYSVRPEGLYSNQQGYIISYLEGALVIDPAALTVTGTIVRNKVYDTTDTATLRGGVLNGVYAGDAVTLTQQGYFASPNAGAGIAVYANDSLGGASAGNYYVIQPTGLSANIVKARVTVTDTVVSSKVYDATTRATLSGGILNGVYGGDDVTLTESGRFVSKNAGTGVAVVTNDKLSGLSSGNYYLVQPTGLTADIAQRNLYVTGLTASDKMYDTTTNATLLGSATIQVLRGDDVTLGGTALGQFVYKYAGDNKSVIVSGNTISGADAGNYNLVQQRGLRANIAKMDLEVGGISVRSKGYDGTTNATLIGTATVTALAADEVTVRGVRSGMFDDPNVGSGKTVTASGFVLYGADARNYNIVQPTGLTGDITKTRLLYVATPATFTIGTTPTGLTGIVTGFFGSDDLFNSTTGSLVWTTNANASSAAGSYRIYGGGLTSSNYNVVQGAGNVNALTIEP